MVELDLQTVLLPYRFPHCCTLLVTIKDLQKLAQVDAQVDGPYVPHIPHNWQLDHQGHEVPLLSVLQGMIIALLFDRQKGEAGSMEKSEIFDFGNN